jgi:hypothetical protein
MGAAMMLLVCAPALAQHIYCCNQLVDVGGSWRGANRAVDCFEYMRRSTSNRDKVCGHVVNGCRPAVYDDEPGPSELVLLLLPAAAAHAQVRIDAGKLWRDVEARTSPVCCPEAAAQCGEDSCKDDPADEGFVYTDKPTSVRSEASGAAAAVAQPPSGSRLLYREYRRVGGRTWFHVQTPGGTSGWLSGDDAACTRPQAPPPPRPSKAIDSGKDVGKASSWDFGGARG